MEKNDYSRRKFIMNNAIAGIGVALAAGTSTRLFANSATENKVPAILGGTPSSTTVWPQWPVWDASTDEKQIIEILRSGVWSRNAVVTEFEKKWAETTGAKRALAVVNGTNALIASLVNLGIGGGDEVIIPPYTFIATAIAVLQTGAMPVFVDIDPETFQIDPGKIEAKITSRTRAIMPVHILGLPADMLRIMEIARKHDLFVIEDACQAHLAEINHQVVGTFGDAGCFSFQNSKNMPIGEGGAIISNNDEFMDRCYSYHNYGSPHGTVVGDVRTGQVILGTKLRMAEYQAAIGLAQLKKLDGQTTTRNENAGFLTSQIKNIPGIIPYKLNPGVTRAAFHLYPFRFNTNEFKGLTRDKFVKALTAEGVPCSAGYTELNKMPYLKDALQSKNFKNMYPTDMLDYDAYMKRNQCPLNEKLCNDEAVWIPQNVLLGSKSDMSNIAMAIEKISKNADAINAKM